ncbi:PP2C family protein-serine/threonine phosphatase [Meridianimarinicoccus aquatilis]|uniref:Serine/threonine-protein phosphatase n=1 Tax=Meridianimarinicoccus aquatilis TaxID=2552766 RepID=A0A4R6AMB2_9RHOB|nr:protein phosphatase 2C domain-containing protein [Fluviibacterium aquatile]QIE43478.1 serine/threonine-protein phosphatase [Rhodobacteraceae bacterium SC52]TDL85481.1 serine/threonine-protein phosphatase [Fluviibacterium aquatile]
MSGLRYNAVTHVGRVRKINEDSILALPDQGIWVVADGMGGHAAGDFASQTVVETVAALPHNLEPADRMRGLRGAIQKAHDAIQIEAERKGGVTIGAAVVALMIADGHFVAFWSGDSRLYLYRDGVIDLLTSDHSVVAELVKSGQMTWDEAEMHPHSNAITHAVGVGDAPGLEKIRGVVRPGDRFLLCSDGLNKYAGFETLRGVLESAPIETATETLLQIALDGGGKDNISVIVVDVS